GQRGLEPGQRLAKPAQGIERGGRIQQDVRHDGADAAQLAPGGGAVGVVFERIQAAVFVGLQQACLRAGRRLVHRIGLVGAARQKQDVLIYQQAPVRTGQPSVLRRGGG